MDDYENYETGSFCRHYGDPSDCEIVCARPGCGHRCTNHGLDGATDCFDCDCREWVEPE